MRPSSAVALIVCLLTILTPPPALSLNWGNPVQLTNNTGIADANPVISRDGKRIAYQAIGSTLPGSEIFAINPDATGMGRLTSNTASDFFPSITGDGTVVVFFSDLDGDFEIFKAKSDGTSLTQLTFNMRHVDSYPVVSSDGSTIAFQTNRTGNLDIFAMRADGSSARQLTFETTRDEAPSITADGSRIAYMSNVTIGGEIFVVNSDGTQPPLRLTWNNCNDRSPMISGDEGWVAFQSDCGGNWEIMLIRTDGTGLRKLTNNLATDHSPSVNYDGTLIAYVSNLDGDDEIYVVSSDGSHVDQLTFNTASDGHPSIDGPGTRIVYQSDIDGQDTELFLVERVASRDVAVTKIVLSRNFSYSGVISNPIKINVTVANQGLVLETFTVTAKANNTMIDGQTVTVAPGTTSVVTFNWDTHLLTRGSYVISAEVSPVPGEEDLADNTFIDDIFTVRLGGDVNNDCIVNISDLARVGASFLKSTGQAAFDIDADLNNDGTVNVLDLVVVGANFLKSC